MLQDGGIERKWKKDGDLELPEEEEDEEDLIRYYFFTSLCYFYCKILRNVHWESRSHPARLLPSFTPGSPQPSPNK